MQGWTRDGGAVVPVENEVTHSIRLRSSVVCVHEGKILGFRAADPLSFKRYFFLPGGQVEDGESPLQSATREALEETGFLVDVDPASELVKHYKFFWNGQSYFCKTYFFRGSLQSPLVAPQEVQDASYHRGVDWVLASEADQVFVYSTEVLRAVKEILKS